MVNTKEKKDLLFLHGYLSCGASFCYQTNYFGKDFNVFAPDLTGFGTNKNMEKPYSLDDYVDWVVAYIKANGIKRPSVIAHSFGTRIVLKATYRYGDIFDKLVLTGAAGLKPKITFKKAIKKGAFKVLKKVIPKEKLVGFYSKDYLSLSPIMRESFIKIVNEHLDYTLDKIYNPTLLIFGDKDLETPLYMAKRLNLGIKNSTLRVYKGAGHFCFLDKRHTFNREVREFLLS